ncbi:isoleucine--tRNA ligase [Desulfohalovibrio reitneri]|uniref:isoleucine--tRNA ligase n=1 Tax=Desulfohalovibrio reitneri TaxID=1307759 RepID=UPI0004A75C76|nr:isoleucine--tRNA ligase [Desulfohalovibrio reitneri]
MSDYKKTLSLPLTSFPMKANLTQREPHTLAKWDDVDAYGRMVAANEGRERYVLHDGPPYANGHIHMGTAMNKVLKDIIVKSRNMLGFKAEYVPGWDCHGLPIEHKVATQLREKGKTDVPPLTVRKICRDYASKFLDIQRKEFKRLGGLGVWDEPYRTMDPAYEAATARELGRFAEKGSVYRGKKPVHWCLDCQTALAEAEVEYADHSSPSIYVAFPCPDAKLSKVLPGGDPERAALVIWTTTPWTLPGNQAVAVHPELEYSLVETSSGQYVLASDLLENLAQVFGWESYEILAKSTGDKLEGLAARHPFHDRDSQVVLADYVTLDAGTGLVHTAPGHGREDFETGQKYGLEVLSPLDDAGRFLPSVTEFAGKTVYEANPDVIALLREKGLLLAEKAMSHSYPHCWRCKKPVIFRATTQWFISMERGGLREKALDAIDNQVRWIPSWGQQRIHSMIENRPDWCISRQRTWGVPIVALLCGDCDEVYQEPEWVFSVVDRFETFERGCDYWFEAPLEDVVPEGLTCPSCGAANWKKEDDILDVWFDSGTSFAAVVEQRPECRFPADLYLEGTDQHRGWFHSSLLAAVGTRGQAPYKSVLTHGYVVDGEGRKMSKSVGNVIAPQEIIDRFGAEILRMWVAAVNYQEDVRLSDEILSRQVDSYRRIRNTCRFILGNLNDFTPDKAVDFADMEPLDRYTLDLVRRAHETMTSAYGEFQFHRVHHTLLDLCTTDLSAFYLDIVKDRLYVETPDGKPRRSAQTVLWKTLLLLLVDMAPVLSFTAEEVFAALPDAIRPDLATVFELRYSLGDEEQLGVDERKAFEHMVDLRDEAYRLIEPMRQAGEIGHTLDTSVTVHLSDAVRERIGAMNLREFFISSGAELTSEPLADGARVKVERAPGEKCPRCWVYAELGTDPDHPEVCPRCARVLDERT